MRKSTRIRPTSGWTLLVVLAVVPSCSDSSLAADSSLGSSTGSTTSTSAAESGSSTGPGAPLDIWDPTLRPFFFATGVNGYDAAWLPTGFTIASQRGVTTFDEDGDSVVFHDIERDVLGATFDGDRVVVADTAKFTVLDAELSVVSSANLIEPCIGLAVINRSHLVCGTDRSYGQAFYSFDLDSGELTDFNEDSFSPLLHIRAVPGRRRFLAIPLRISPGKLELWDIQDGAVLLSGESPHHGDFLMNTHYAFLGDPATHLIAPGGDIVRILSDMGGCDGTFNITPGENCLTRDGTLGLLPDGATRYLDLQTGADGFVYGLYSRDEFGSEPGCEEEGTCFLQRIDVDGRTVIDERPALLDVHKHFYLYPHPDGRGVAIVGHEEDRWKSIEPDAPSGGWSAYYAGI